MATYEAITDMLNGTLTGEIKVYNLANNGVGYAISNEAINQYAGTLEELKAQIIDGTITVPDEAGRLSRAHEQAGGAGHPAPPSRPAARTTPVTDTTAGIAAIELRDIVKRFPGVVANDGVNLRVMPGTIHAIVGENGAGKSTLMKILYGAQPPDEGRILVNELEQNFRSPRDAIGIGIGMVFQHFMLADNLTVWENIVLGDEPGTGAAHGRRRGPQAHPRARAQLRPQRRPR